MEGKVFNLLVGSLIFLRKKRRLTVSRTRRKSLFIFFIFFSLSLKTFSGFSCGDLFVIILILNNVHFSHSSLPNRQHKNVIFFKKAQRNKTNHCDYQHTGKATGTSGCVCLLHTFMMVELRAELRIDSGTLGPIPNPWKALYSVSGFC